MPLRGDVLGDVLCLSAQLSMLLRAQALPYIDFVRCEGKQASEALCAAMQEFFDSAEESRRGSLDPQERQSFDQKQHTRNTNPLYGHGGWCQTPALRCTSRSCTQNSPCFTQWEGVEGHLPPPMHPASALLQRWYAE